jgi:Flp pilus assembly protein TadB
VNRLRLILALAGFLLALLSVAFNDRQVGWAAIALLTASLILRLLLRKRENGTSDRGQGL